MFFFWVGFVRRGNAWVEYAPWIGDMDGCASSVPMSWCGSWIPRPGPKGGDVSGGVAVVYG